MDMPPPITNLDATLDHVFFDDHPRRTCYARAAQDGWVLIVKCIVSKRAPAVMLRVWARDTTVPDTEQECLKLWDRFAWERQ